MGRTQSRPRPRPKAKLARKPVHTIAKTVRVATSCAALFVTDAHARAVVKRGLTVSEALALCSIFKCTIVQLLTWYKVTQAKRHNVLVQARAYVAKHGLPVFKGDVETPARPVPKKAKARKPPPKNTPKNPAKNKRKKPPKKPVDEPVVWIGDHLDVWVPLVDGVRAGVRVTVKRLEKHDGTTVDVDVTDTYDSKDTVSSRIIPKTSVVGRLRAAFQKDDHTLAPGALVRFWVDHVKKLEAVV